MGNYSKLIGTIVGGAAGILINIGVLPESLATAEIQNGIVVVLAAIATYIFPANNPDA